MPGGDHFQHFLDAQEPVYDRVLDELRAGHKRGHWIWFIFPQLRGLGSSAMNRRFALDSVAEATAYARHPVLGPRLRECCRVLLAGEQEDPRAIFGSLDALKLRSCMTLFQLAAPECAEFSAVLARFYAGQADAATLELLDSP